MKKRSQGLGSVKHYSEHREQMASRDLQQALGNLRQQEARLQELVDYRNEYAQRLNTEGQTGISGQAIKSFHNFLLSIDKAIAGQKQYVKQAGVEYEQRKQLWLAARNRVKAVDKVVDRYTDEENRAEEKLAQKEQDDRAAGKSGGNKQGS